MTPAAVAVRMQGASSLDRWARIVAFGPLELGARALASGPTIGHGNHGGSCCASCALNKPCESTCTPPVIGESPIGTGLGLRTKDAIAYADRLDGYVEDLAKDIDEHVSFSAKTPAQHVKDLGLDPESSYVKAAIAKLTALQAGKSSDQLTKEAAFSSAWNAWKVDWDGFMVGTVSPWKTSMTATAKEKDWKKLEASEAEIMDWRKRYTALGYAPSKPAPTSKEIEATAPANPNPIADAAKGIGDAAKWILLAVLGAGAVTMLRR